MSKRPPRYTGPLKRVLLILWLGWGLPLLSNDCPNLLIQGVKAFAHRFSEATVLEPLGPSRVFVGMPGGAFPVEVTSMEERRQQLLQAKGSQGVYELTEGDSRLVRHWPLDKSDGRLIGVDAARTRFYMAERETAETVERFEQIVAYDWSTGKKEVQTKKVVTPPSSDLSVLAYFSSPQVLTIQDLATDDRWKIRSPPNLRLQEHEFGSLFWPADKSFFIAAFKSNDNGYSLLRLSKESSSPRSRILISQAVPLALSPSGEHLVVQTFAEGVLGSLVLIHPRPSNAVKIPEINMALPYQELQPLSVPEQIFFSPDEKFVYLTFHCREITPQRSGPWFWRVVRWELSDELLQGELMLDTRDVLSPADGYSPFSSIQVAGQPVRTLAYEAPRPGQEGGMLKYFENFKLKQIWLVEDKKSGPITGIRWGVAGETVVLSSFAGISIVRLPSFIEN